MEKLRSVLEREGWPDGRTLSHNKKLRDEVLTKTSFLSDDVRMSQRLQCIENLWDSIPSCEVCGSPNKYSAKKNYGGNYGGWSRTCSKECFLSSESRMQRTRNTMVERYGVEFSGQSKELLGKRNQTMLDRYGVTHYLESEEGREKFNATMQERYGVDWALQSEEIYEKFQTTSMKKYGTASPLENKEVILRRMNTWRNKYGKHPNQSHISSKSMVILECPDLLQEHYDSFNSNESAAEDLGISRATYVNHLRRHGLQVESSKSSFHEEELAEFVESLGEEVILNDRLVLGGRELDVLVPSKKVAFEMNGLFWHSEEKKGKMYHQEKSLDSMKAGIRLIHIWEDDWIHNKDTVKEKIRAVLGLREGTIYARKCSIARVFNSDVRSLYDVSHIQGHINSSHNYALFFEGDIVAAMSFKIYKDGYAEMTRFAAKVPVVGGFARLLSLAKKTLGVREIRTYAHLDYSHGDIYSSNGFTNIGITPPNYWYVKGTKRFSRNMFMKHKLKDKLEIFNPSLTEVENMCDNGYYRIFDAGSIRFSLKW